MKSRPWIVGKGHAGIGEPSFMGDRGTNKPAPEEWHTGEGRPIGQRCCFPGKMWYYLQENQKKGGGGFLPRNAMPSTRTILMIGTALLVGSAAILLAVRAENQRIRADKDVPASGQTTIILPRPNHAGTTSIEQALRERRSHRVYEQDPLSLVETAQLLWAAQGVTHRDGFRTAPSAGALYPLETYLVTGGGKYLPAGVYRYQPQRHQLTLVQSGDLRGKLCAAALRQPAVCNAPASIVFSAVFARTTGKYGKRGVRFTHMEAGSAAQNVALQAVSLNLGTVVIGSFDDDAVQKTLSMPATEAPLAIMPVGRKRPAE